MGILTEGWDLPALGCVIDAAPTASLARHLQKAGRGLRPYPGKEQLLLHDHAGNLKIHGLPSWERDYSLAASAVKRAPAGAVSIVRICDDCFGANPAAALSCSQCGVVFEVKAQDIKQLDAADALEESVAELEAAHAAKVRIKPATTEAKGREFLRLAAVAKSKNYSRGWISHRFKDVFGVWPQFRDGVLEALTPAEKPYVPEVLP